MLALFYIYRQQSTSVIYMMYVHGVYMWRIHYCNFWRIYSTASTAWLGKWYERERERGGLQDWSAMCWVGGTWEDETTGSGFQCCGVLLGSSTCGGRLTWLSLLAHWSKKIKSYIQTCCHRKRWQIGSTSLIFFPHIHLISFMFISSHQYNSHY